MAASGAGRGTGRRRRWLLGCAAAGLAAAVAGGGALAAGKQPIVGLVTKTEVNPYLRQDAPGRRGRGESQGRAR